MGLFGKKKKIQIDSKFKLGEFVYFKYRDDLKFGRVFSINKDSDGTVIYAVQIGGECPIIIENLKEATLFTN